MESVFKVSVCGETIEIYIVLVWLLVRPIGEKGKKVCYLQGKCVLCKATQLK